MTLESMTALTDTLGWLLALIVPALAIVAVWEGASAYRARRRRTRRLPPPSAACRRGMSGTDYYRVSKTPRSL